MNDFIKISYVEKYGVLQLFFVHFAFKCDNNVIIMKIWRYVQQKNCIYGFSDCINRKVLDLIFNG